MKTILKNINYIALGFLLLIILFSSSKAYANSYTQGCTFGGNITTEASLTPGGPFTTTTTQFFAQGRLETNNCPTLHVSLGVKHNGGSEISLIPATTVLPTNSGPFPAGLPAQTSFSSLTTPATYPVTFITGLDEDDEIIIPPGGQCINDFQFMGVFRWGKVHYSGPTNHPPVTVNVTLVGWSDPQPPSQTGGERTVVFTFPSNSNHSFHNFMDCSAGSGCEIEGTGGFDHGYVASISPAGSCPPPPQNHYYNNCFVADTLVTLSDGSKKNIQDIKIGDILKGEKTNNTVLGFHRPKLDGKVYSFNGGRYFVTEEHPFKTTSGWKSINPSKTSKENIGIAVTQLEVGDTLITDNGLVRLNSIDGKNEAENTPLYNFMLSGDHTYYADGYLVHNKQSCSNDGQGMIYSCSANIPCIDNYGYPLYQEPYSGTCAIGCVVNGTNYPFCQQNGWYYCPAAGGQC